jgi:nicotinamide-nucleotide amidase
MLPGVPREMRGMARDVLLPLLTERGAMGDRVIRSRTLRTTGVAESLLQDRLAGADVPEGLALAFLPGVDGVDLRLTTEGSAHDADRALEAASAVLRARIGDAVYAEGDTELAAVLLDLCRARRVRVAVAESCTGGMLGARLTAIPGSSDVFVGGVIAYANEVKLRELGVSPRELDEHGAVSEAVVRRMASGVCEKFGVELGLGISGVAGPGGGTPDKPVGLVWVAVALGDRVEARSFQSVGDRGEVRHRGAQAAMELARRMMSGPGGQGSR